MILDSANAKRLILYFMYDKDGIVDDYVPYMLRELKKNCRKLHLMFWSGKIKVLMSGRIRQDLNITDGTRSDPLTK